MDYSEEIKRFLAEAEKEDGTKEESDLLEDLKGGENHGNDQ